MYLNGFSVRIPEGVETNGGYVEMEHGKSYRLVLRNNNYQRCDARVEIDGKHVGTWRIEGGSNITLERPAHDDGRFTFYRVGTEEAQRAGLQVGDPNLGLVKVTFMPEACQSVRPLPSGLVPASSGGSLSGEPGDTYTLTGAAVSGATYTSNSFSVQSRAAGGTGLSGHSNQQFGSASYIQYDYSRQTVIYLRLVSATEGSGPRPLTAFSTPVPPVVR